MKAGESLRRAEENFDQLVEGVSDYAIFLLDASGHVASWNEGARRLKGYAADEILGRHFSRFYPPEVAGAGWPEEELRRAAAEGRIEDEGWRVRKDGSRFWANVVITALRDEAGGLRGFLKITRDLTERRRAEEELRRANEALEVRVAERTAELERAVGDLREEVARRRQAQEAAEAALRAKDDFLAVLGHELRTPLTPVLASASALEGRPDLDPDLRDDIGVIRRNVEQEARLIDDLLDLTRILRGEARLHTEAVDAHAALRAALESCQATIEAKRLEVSLELWAGRPVVRADPARLQQVFWNLIDNAAKFTPRGGPDHPAVGQRRLRPAGDPGGGHGRRHRAGGAAEDLRRLRAARSDVARGPGRAGAGPQPVPQAGRAPGRAAGGGQRGAGPRGDFTLETGRHRRRARAARSRRRPARGRGGGGCRSCWWRTTRTRCGSSPGCWSGWATPSSTARSVGEALELAARERFDLLVSDIGLPDGSGLDVMRAVRGRHGLRGIALSGFGRDDGHPPEPGGGLRGPPHQAGGLRGVEDEDRGDRRRDPISRSRPASTEPDPSGRSPGSRVQTTRTPAGSDRVEGLRPDR